MASRNHELSQHFLKSPSTALKLIGHSNIKKRDLVLDIGAGSGVITSALAKRAGEVWAIEPDQTTAQKLRINTRQHQNIKIIEKDIFDLTLPDTPYKIFANPPFAIVSDILRTLNRAKHRPATIYFILQKQLAKKLIQNPDFNSALGIELAVNYTAKIRLPLHKTDFTPPPAVDTVFVEFKHRESPLLPAKDKPAFAHYLEAEFHSPLYSTHPSRLSVENHIQSFHEHHNHR